METCQWPNNDPMMIDYHDKEWGVPVHDDQKHFEFMLLDAFQAGLSWSIILKKREGFRKAFDQFDYRKVAKYDETKIQGLLNNSQIIRNQQKIRATVNNAQRFLEIQKEFGSFNQYIWQFTGFKTKQNKFTRLDQLPATSIESDTMSKDLKRGALSLLDPQYVMLTCRELGW